ncbi:TRAP transporter large permease [Roseospira goensis]|uniref:TRAP transporter large permease protein n=1 Tax=Roseospira goensis TaxID=391922 RepID=A0A7W6RZ36_9PROT|nr:TRAP transporter large permease [Roseospira goensis]MBB4285370.1 tripartite ATP-independent transporter DctM subunit [Roseospira goensis]
MTWAMLAVFAVLVTFGAPLFIALLAAALTGFLWIGDVSMFRLAVQQFFDGIDVFTLMAIPFFILAGLLMNHAGLTDRLLVLCRALVGKVRGGLGHVNIVASILFAGVNGSAAADSSALGSILIPAMAKEGYSRAYAAGLTAGSSLIGPIIPPSIFMILYGTMTGTSIGGLFVAGVIPGLVLGIAFMVLNGLHARRHAHEIREGGDPSVSLGAALWQSVPALIAPVIILGGIIAGVVTPTESGALAVAYVIAAGFLLTRTLTVAALARTIAETARLSSAIFLIIGAAAVIGWLLTFEQVPQRFAGFVLGFAHDPLIVLLILSAITFIIGMFMEEIAALVLLTPVFAPIALAAGIDPLHFGIVMTLNITIALITPPMGACVYIVSAVGNVPIEHLFRTIWPFVVTALVALLAIIALPPITTTLPRLFGFE